MASLVVGHRVVGVQIFAGTTDATPQLQPLLSFANRLSQVTRQVIHCYALLSYAQSAEGSRTGNNEILAMQHIAYISRFLFSYKS